VEAFPYQRFGVIRGYISKIHPTVISAGDTGFPVPTTEPVYEVEVFITREHINAYGERHALRPGMIVQADIAIDRRRLWQQLFDPLLAAGKLAR
jgi:membrane fusion protein